MSKKLNKSERDILINKELLKRLCDLEVIEPEGKSIIANNLSEYLDVKYNVYYGVNTHELKIGWNCETHHNLWFLGETTQEALESIPTICNESHNDCIIRGTTPYA